MDWPTALPADPWENPDAPDETTDDVLAPDSSLADGDREYHRQQARNLRTLEEWKRSKP